MEKKLTKKEMFEMIKGVCAERAEIVDFCNHEIELLSRKNSSNGQTKTQKENEEIKVAIVDALRKVGKAVTITELQASDEKMASYSNQKLSALLKQLVDTKEVVKVTDKKKSMFSIGE